MWSELRIFVDDVFIIIIRKIYAKCIGITGLSDQE